MRKIAAVLVVIPLLAAACTSSGNGTGDTTTTPPVFTPPASSPSASETPSSAGSTPAGSVTITFDQAKAGLLTPAEVGPAFTKARFQASDEPLPCTPNDPPLAEQFPSNSQVGTAFLTSGAAIGEDVRVYPDATSAGRVVAAAGVGVNCASGRLNLTGTPTTVEFAKVNGSRLQNVTSDVGADVAFAVTGSTDKLGIVLVGCQVGNAAVLFSFLRAKSTPTSSLPNPIAIVAKAVEKLKNA